MIGLALLPMGCLGPGPASLSPPASPDRWHAGTTEDPAVAQAWLHDFASPPLNKLVHEALAHNLTLQQAVHRRNAAREKVVVAESTLWPIVQLGLNRQRTRSNAAGQATTRTSHTLEGSVGWEVDLWGRLEASLRSTDALASAAEEDLRAARFSLAADVAQTWFGVVAAEQQVLLAEHALASYQRGKEVVEERYRLGLVHALDVRLARTDLAEAGHTLAQRRREQAAIVRSLEVLLGRYPKGALKGGVTLPRTLVRVPAGLPSDLLARRPDILAAERRLVASGARVDAARKNRLPSLRLSAGAGMASPELRDILDWDTLVWNLVGGITQPLFQGGRLKAEEALARMERQEVWAAYAQAVLVAFREVETALSADTHHQAQEEALALAAKEAALAADLALSQYQNGLVDMITLLETQRRVYRIKSTHLRAVRERLNNRIALYLALGGDFQGREAPQRAPIKDQETQR